VNEKDLYDALVEKRIAGAAIDVYSKEPAKKEEYPFVSLPNVVALPHLGASTKESQSRTSRIIVQNIMEALEHGTYFDAVNLPFNITITDAELYRPVIRLAKRLGQFAGSYFGKTPTTITIKHRLEKIDQVSPIIMTLVTNILSKTESDVSLINIEEKLAEKHVELFVSADTDLTYNNSLRVTLGNGVDSFDTKGTFIFTIPKIVEVQHYLLDIVPMGRMMLIRNLNVPGVIGNVGTLLGKNGINISDFHYAHITEGKETLGCVGVDEDIPDEILAKVKALENVVDVKKINIE
jgi:D-3-phosphoglycerate dehydrogenase